MKNFFKKRVLLAVTFQRKKTIEGKQDTQNGQGTSTAEPAEKKNNIGVEEVKAIIDKFEQIFLQKVKHFIFIYE